MSAPTKGRTPPVQVVEANTLQLWQAEGEKPMDFWRWTLRNDNTVSVAGAPYPIPNGLLGLFQTLCAVFDLQATPEYYARRAEKRELHEVQCGGGGRWLTIEIRE